MTGELAMDHLQIEAGGTVERYVAGTLPSEERDRFEAHLVDCPACLDHVETAERIRSGLATSAPARKVRPSRPRALVPALAFAAGVALALVPAAFAVRDLRRARSDLEAAGAARAEVDRRLPRAGEEVARERVERQAAQAKLAELSRPGAAAVALLVASRGAGGAAPEAVLRIPKDARWAVLSVDVGGFTEYRGLLLGADGRTRWTFEPLQGGREGLGVAVPSSALPPGDYVLRLEGLSPRGWSAAGRFGFRVVSGP